MLEFASLSRLARERDGRRPVPSTVAHRILADQLLLPSLALATYYHQREQRAVELLQRKEKELNEVKALLHGMNVRHSTWAMRLTDRAALHRRRLRADCGAAHRIAHGRL